MKQLNLLPSSIRKKATQRKQSTLGALGFLVGAALIVSVYLPLKQQTDDLSAKAANLKLVTASDQPSADTKASLELEAAANRAMMVNELSKIEVEWPKAFALVGEVTPQDVSLTNYSFSTAGGNFVMKLGGKAPSNLSFAVFIESLKANPLLISNVVEGYSFDTSSGKVSFTVTLTVAMDKVVYNSVP